MRIKNRQQALAVVAAGLVGLLLADRLVFTPLVAFWKRRADQLVTVRTSVLQGEALIEREPIVMRQWDQMQSNMLVGEISVAEDRFLKAVERWAQEGRVSLSSVKPQWQRGTDKFATLECNLEASGNLSAITRFLYEIERDPMGVKIVRTQINARDDAGEQLTLNLQLSALAMVDTGQKK